MNEYLNFQYYDYIGIIGAGIILFFFLANQFDRIKNDNIYYDFGNFLGSVFLVFFAVKTKSLPFIVLNSVWGLVSLKDVIYKILKNKED